MEPSGTFKVRKPMVLVPAQNTKDRVYSQITVLSIHVFHKTVKEHSRLSNIYNFKIILVLKPLVLCSDQMYSFQIVTSKNA